VTLPLSIGMALAADYAVAVVLGPQWQAAVMPLRILCLYAAFYTSQLLIGSVLMWTGQFRANMWCSVLAGVLLPLAFLIGTRWGLEGVAWAWSIAFPLANLPAMVISFRTIEIGFGAWLRSLLPAAVSCAGLSAALVGVRVALPAETPVALAAALACTAGGVAYLATLWIGFRPRVLVMIEFLRSLRRQSIEGAPVAAAP
jgi:O-antigen/teichoic acid export membrane protein